MGIKPNFTLYAAGSLGMELTETKDGLIVKTVYAGSPAADAGIQADDKIESIRTTNVKTLEELKKAVSKAKPGELLKINILRGKEKKSVTATLGQGL